MSNVENIFAKKVMMEEKTNKNNGKTKLWAR